MNKLKQAVRNAVCKKLKCICFIGLRNIWRQFIRDIYDKETQSAATYSYMWIADQVGHIGVGMLLYLLLIAIDRLLGGQAGWLGDVEHRMLLYIGLALAVMLVLELYKFAKAAARETIPAPFSQRFTGVIRRQARQRADLLIFLYPLFLCYLFLAGFESSYPQGTNVLVIALFIPAFWEYSTFKDAAAKHKKLFPLDRRGLAFNALTATWYMWIGVLLGYGFDIGGSFALQMFLAMLLAAVVVAPWWLCQKIVWQKAALPYLSRLGTVDCPIFSNPQAACDIVERVQHAFIDAICADGGSARAMVVCGDIESGRTRLVAAIGTELCFRYQKVRYISFDKMLEMLTVKADAAEAEKLPAYRGPENIVYWCWRNAQVLIIDDINAALSPDDEVKAGRKASQSPYQQLTEDMWEKLQNQARFDQRHTIWVLGEVVDRHEWVERIRRLCGTQPLEVILSTSEKA